MQNKVDIFNVNFDDIPFWRKPRSECPWGQLWVLRSFMCTTSERLLANKGHYCLPRLLGSSNGQRAWNFREDDP